jgi:hypothetical protein
MAAAAAREDKGLILVFDLDQTIIDSSNIHDLLAVEEAKPEANSKAWDVLASQLNPELIHAVLAPAVALRDAGHVDAIFMLTNNADRGYVANVCYLLGSMLKSEGKFEFIRNSNEGNRNFPHVVNVFDYVMVRQHPWRQASSNPPKSLDDVKFMMEALHITYTDDGDLARRTFFFDDNVGHVLAQELNDQGYPNHYIAMKGPESKNGVNLGFLAGKHDLTDYTAIQTAFRRIRKGLEAVPAINATAAASAKQAAFATRARELAARTAVALRKSPPSAAEQRYIINIVSVETGLSDANSRSYLEKAGWDKILATDMIVHNMTTGGRRKKTIMRRLRRIYGRKMTRRHK